MFPLRNLLLLVLSLLAVLPWQAQADRHRRSPDLIENVRYRDWDRGGDRMRGDDRGGREISLDQAVQMVQRRYNAQVVRAETIREGGRTIYRLRLLNQDGRVWTVTVDAASGR